MESNNTKYLQKSSDLQEENQTQNNENWHKTKSAIVNQLSEEEQNESGVNALGAPLLGDNRDLFRPASKDIPAQPGVYK